MKYLLNKTNIAERQFTYNDVIEKKATGFGYDYYGGNVQYFGRTEEGFLLCIKKNKAEIIDIFVDEDLLTPEGLKLLLKDKGEEVPFEPPKNEPTEEHDKLVAQAKALGIKGILKNMKEETLLKKIKEAQNEKETEKDVE